MLKKISSIFFVFLLVISCKKESDYQVISTVPDLEMPNNHLKFTEISDYKNYKIISTHFRTDKNELRYILANQIAFKAFVNKTAFPNGSKIVKIGWTVKKMAKFTVALESNEVQRIEYMIKDDKRFSKNPGNWGYARFIKENSKYKPWRNGTKSCISCHNLAKETKYVFSHFQELQ